MPSRSQPVLKLKQPAASRGLESVSRQWALSEEEPGAELEAQRIARVAVVVDVAVLVHFEDPTDILIRRPPGFELELLVDEVLAAPHDFPTQTHLLDRLP